MTLFEEFPLTSIFIHVGVLLFIESIDSEYVENMVELFAFMNELSHAAGFESMHVMYVRKESSRFSQCIPARILGRRVCGL